MDILQIVENEIDARHSEIKNVRLMLATDPDCSVKIRVHKGITEIYVRRPDASGNLREEYIGKRNSQAAAKYAGIFYGKKLLPVLESELNLLLRFKKEYRPQDKYAVYHALPDQIREIVNPLVCDFRTIAKNWEGESGQDNDYPFEEGSCYLTRKGERVRSRAELIIADILAELELPYKYEAAYYFENGRHSFPDFTILSPKDGREYYLEYFGLMSDPDYAQNALEKIRRYAASADANRFIYIFESSAVSLDTKAVKNLIFRYFL